jgi:hypothetical protein
LSFFAAKQISPSVSKNNAEWKMFQRYRLWKEGPARSNTPIASRRSSLRQNSLQQIRSIFVSSRDVEHALTNLRVLDFIRLSPKLLSAIAYFVDSGFSIVETRSHEGGNRQQSRLVPPPNLFGVTNHMTRNHKVFSSRNGVRPKALKIPQENETWMPATPARSRASIARPEARLRASSTRYGRALTPFRTRYARA